MWCDMVTWLTDGGCSVFVWKKFTQIIAWKKSRTNFWCCHETFEWLFGANYITLWMLFFFTWFFKHLGWFKLWHDCPFQHPNKGSQWLHWGKPPTEVSQDDKIPQPFTPCSQEKDCRTAEADVLFPNTWVMSLGTFLCMRVFGKEGHKNIWSQFPVMNQIRWKVNVWNTIILETWFCLPPSQSTLSSIFHYILRWQVKLVRTYVSHCFIGDFWWFDVSKTIGKYHVGQTQPLRSGDISPKVRLHFFNFLLISILLEEMSHGWILGFKNSQNSFTGW